MISQKHIRGGPGNIVTVVEQVVYTPLTPLCTILHCYWSTFWIYAAEQFFVAPATVTVKMILYLTSHDFSFIQSIQHLIVCEGKSQRN